MQTVDEISSTDVAGKEIPYNTHNIVFTSRPAWQRAPFFRVGLTISTVEFYNNNIRAIILL